MGYPPFLENNFPESTFPILFFPNSHFSEFPNFFQIPILPNPRFLIIRQVGIRENGKFGKMGIRESEFISKQDSEK